MSNPRSNYQIAWSPHKDSNTNLFLVGASNDLRLYEYTKESEKSKLVLMSPLISSMAAMKCFAWSPDPTFLSIAAGFATGKILLINLRDNESYVVLNSKNSKPCNHIAFSSAEPRLLATGFDKSRNEHGLLIWDVEKAKSLSLNKDNDDSASVEMPNKTSVSGAPNVFCRVEDLAAFPDMAKFGVYEPPLAQRPLPTLRFDTQRNDAIYSFGLSESVNSISWFPTNSKQLVAGISGKSLRIFDLRLSDNATITIATKAVLGVKTDPFNDHRFASFEDGFIGNVCLWDDRKANEAILSVSTETRPVQISFSTSRSGLLSSLCNDASYISLYDIKETSRKSRKLQSNHNLQSDDVDSSDHGSDGVGRTFNNFGGKIDEELDVPVLWRSRKTQRSSKSLVSFAWIPTISTTHSHRLLAINKDQTFETITSEESPNFDWVPRGNISIFGPKSFTYNIDHDYEDMGGRDNIGDNDMSEHKHHVLKADSDYHSGNRTPRPDDKNMLNGEKEALKELQEDISVVMRKRTREGYSMNCERNKEIVKDFPKLKALWDWIDRAEESGNFGFQGIHSAWTGVKKLSPMSTPRASPPRTSERFDQRVDANELSISVTTYKSEHRKSALIICGWGFGKKELEEELQSMERAGDYMEAAGLAFFHGKIDRAIEALNNSKDERLKLVSTALAGYVVNNYDKSSQAKMLWSEICKSLSLEMNDPHLRAIFSYIASGNWLDVLNEKVLLSLQDRIGIALRFLDDEELNSFLHDITAKVISDGDIDGVILTGLTQEGVSLFENYINNTCDVQTASLALSFVDPKKLTDIRVGDWIEDYRKLLDQWEMFHERVRFDIARGKHTSSAADMVPPQVYVRCNFCSQSVSQQILMTFGKKKKPVALQQFSGVPGMKIKQKAISCHGCRKPLPRCSICLLNLGTPAEDLTALQNGSSNDKPSGFDLWFTWCQSCRHGGHTIHILEWFVKHKVCPVSECTCECKIADTSD